MAAATSPASIGSFFADLSKAIIGSETSTTHTLSLKPYVQNQQLEDLLMWRDPIKSGAVFAVMTVGYLVLALSGLGIFSIGCYALMSAILGMFVWYNAGKTLKYPPPPVPDFLANGLTEKDVQELTTKYLDSVNKGLSFIYRLASGKDIVLTGKAVAALFMVAKLFQTIDPFSLAYLIAFVSFTAPKIYEVRKDEIDAALDKAVIAIRQGYDMLKEKVLDKIPTAKKTD
eukprot:TRINITY_DN20703_c0_g1_i1.p1 TRINITY_DN20703_c0_g1~~TRINITY_DN20703_c0_g1_i1.p1  ORF type:complete len:260 (+),score=26.91 TRINITY_DN20703_c0_g1_i1:96-782(+)